MVNPRVLVAFVVTAVAVQVPVWAQGGVGLPPDSGSSVEFSAPAVDIASASGEFPDDSLAVFIGDGTSFAAPMVSGIASLCMDIRPATNRADLEFALAESAVDLGLPGCDTDFGCGRVNAHGTLLSIQSLIFIDSFETGDFSKWPPSSP